jgi:hypothetical protein
MAGEERLHRERGNDEGGMQQQFFPRLRKRERERGMRGMVGGGGSGRARRGAKENGVRRPAVTREQWRRASVSDL